MPIDSTYQSDITDVTKFVLDSVRYLDAVYYKYYSLGLLKYFHLHVIVH